MRPRLPQFLARFMAMLLAMLLPSVALAETEYVRSNGKLSLTAFYRTVACAGAQLEHCGNVILRWPSAERQNLTVGLSQVDAGSGRIHGHVVTALAAAIAEINASGANIRLIPVTGRAAKSAKIQLFVLTPDANGQITATRSDLLRDQMLSSALIRMQHRGSRILRADIAISSEIAPRTAKSVVLEELVQSLGLMTDILNPHYRYRSVFAEDCDCTSHLAGQDIAVLRMHYPPPR